MIKKLAIAATAVIFAATGALAGVNDSAGIIFPELENGAGARAAAMGNAFTAVADDASAAYWNPAGLSQVRRACAALTYDKWFMDSFYGHIMAALPFPAGTLGTDIFYMNYGAFNKLDINGLDAGGSVTPYTISGLLAYGISLGNGFSLGASFKAINQSIAGSGNTGFAGDAALHFKTGIFSAGLIGSNLGTGGSFSMPSSIRGGIALVPVIVPSHNLVISVDGRYVFKDAPDVSGGMEYTFEKVFSVRAGYKYRIGENSLNGLTGLTAGAGLNLGPLGFDYAFVPFGSLGTAHRATMKLEFGAAEAQPAAKAKAEPAPVSLTKSEEELYKMFFEAGTLENSGKLEAAAAKYKEILKSDSVYAPAWKRLGAVFFKMKNKPMAVKCFESYLKIKPDDEAVRNWLKKNK